MNWVNAPAPACRSDGLRSGEACRGGCCSGANYLDAPRSGVEHLMAGGLSHVAAGSIHDFAGSAGRYELLLWSEMKHLCSCLHWAGDRSGSRCDWLHLRSHSDDLHLHSRLQGEQLQRHFR